MTAPRYFSYTKMVQLFCTSTLQPKEFWVKPQEIAACTLFKVEAPRWLRNSQQRMSLFTYFTELHAKVQATWCLTDQFCSLFPSEICFKNPPWVSCWDHHLDIYLDIMFLSPRLHVSLKTDFLLTQTFLSCISLTTKTLCLIFCSHAHKEQNEHYHKLRGNYSMIN